MPDALTVGDDPVLDSLGAFLAASLLPDTPPATPPVSPWPTAVDPALAIWIEPAVAAPVLDDLAVAAPVLDDLAVAAPESRSVPEVETDEEGQEPVGPSALRLTVEWVGIVAAALVVALVVRLFVIQSFAIPSESMHPTLQAGDRVLVNRLAYRAHDIRRGDVIVFRRPIDAELGPNPPAHLIKRVIGLPGDTIAARNGIVYIDGRRLREPYLPAGTLTTNLSSPVTIPAGHVWVMGDNRMDSTDSRIFGPIDIKLVVGRAFARVWPPSRIGFL